MEWQQGAFTLSLIADAFNGMWVLDSCVIVLGQRGSPPPGASFHTTFVEISSLFEGPIRSLCAGVSDRSTFGFSPMCLWLPEHRGRSGQMAVSCVFSPRLQGFRRGAGTEDAKSSTPAMASTPRRTPHEFHAEVRPRRLKPASCRLPHN